jgi:cardiolipin synthase
MNRGEYKSMLDAKCSIYEYNGFVHAKYYIIDNKYVLIGSCNLDFRSLLMHFENGILINNSTFAKQLSEVFNKDKLNSEAVTIAS